MQISVAFPNGLKFECEGDPQIVLRLYEEWKAFHGLVDKAGKKLDDK